MSEFEDSNSFSDQDFEENYSHNQALAENLSQLSFQTNSERNSPQLQERQNESIFHNQPEEQNSVNHEKLVISKPKRQIVYNYEELKQLQKVKKQAIKPKWNQHFSRQKICIQIPDLKNKIESKKTKMPECPLETLQVRANLWALQRDRKIFSKSRQQFMKRTQLCYLRPKIL